MKTPCKFFANHLCIFANAIQGTTLAAAAFWAMLHPAYKHKASAVQTKSPHQSVRA